MGFDGQGEIDPVVDQKLGLERVAKRSYFEQLVVEGGIGKGGVSDLEKAPASLKVSFN